MAQDDFISGLLADAPQGASVPTPAPSSGDFISEMLSKSLQASEPMPAPSLPPDWNLMDSIAQGMTLGGYKPLLASARSKLRGTDVNAERAYLDKAQGDYSHDHSLANQLGELGGSLPPTGVAMALGQEYAAAPLAARLASVAPKATAYITGGEGLVPWAGRAIGRLANYAGQGSLAEMTQMGLTGETPLEAAESGAKVGVLAGPVGSALAAPVKAAIEPYVAGVASKFKDLGQTLYTNQVKGAPYATKFLGDVPRSSQIDDLTKGVAKTFGHDADTITPELIRGPGGALERAGATIENAARDSTIPGNDPKLVGALRSTMQDAAEAYGGTDTKEFRSVYNLFNKVSQKLDPKTGTLSGKDYTDLTQKGSDLWNAMSRTSPNRQYAIGIKDALDDALERANPAQAQEIAAGRHMYHNALIAEDAVGPDGKVIPSKLASLVESNRHYGSTYTASQKASSAAPDGTLGDIGTLAEGSRLFLNGKNQGLLGSIKGHSINAGLGAVAATALAENPYIEHALGAIPGASYAATGMGTLGAMYGSAGLALNRPQYLNQLLRGHDIAAMSPNFAIPAATNYLTDRKPGYKPGGQ